MVLEELASFPDSIPVCIHLLYDWSRVWEWRQDH